ncbi:hypothetical protein MMC20_003213 [Loxospora ochrophaea]|nr:hypothetical protein [Loxospora ochrophaea]
MATSRLPSIDALPSLSALERADVLDQLFEPCLQLHTLSVELLGSERFPSYDDMIASIGVQLTDLAESGLDSDLAWLAKILGAHPRLGEKKVDSAQSRAEQAQLNTGRANQEAELTDLNDQYERTFPGLRYVWVLRLHEI